MYIFKLFETNRMIVFGEKKKEIKKMGIEKQKMKQKEENILNKVVKRKKGNNKKKQENQEENENVTETNELVLSKNLMKKEKITRDQTRRCKNKRRSKKNKWIFFEPLGTLLLIGKICKHNVNFFRMFFSERIVKRQLNELEE